jgi:hypothetical protein
MKPLTRFTNWLVSWNFIIIFFILMLCLAPFLMGCSLSSRVDNDSFSFHIQRVYLEED